MSALNANCTSVTASCNQCSDRPNVDSIMFGFKFLHLHLSAHKTVTCSFLQSFRDDILLHSPFQCSTGLRRGSAVDRLLRLRVRIPPGAWMSVCCKCCVLSDGGLCDGPIPRLEESYRLWGVIVCDLQTSNNEAALVHVSENKKFCYTC